MFFKTNSIRLTTSSKQRSKDNSYYKEEKDSLESIANIIKQYQLEYFTSNNEKGTSEKKREILLTILRSIQKDLIFQLKEQNKKKEEIAQERNELKENIENDEYIGKISVRVK